MWVCYVSGSRREARHLMRKKRGFVALLAVLLVANLAMAQQGGGHHGGGHAGGQTGGGRTGSAPTTPPPGGFGVSQINLRPGWGLAPPSGFGNIGFPGGGSVIQPLPMVIQPLVNPFQQAGPQFNQQQFSPRRQRSHILIV